MLNWIILIELIIYIKKDLVLNNLQRLICHKPQPTDQIMNFDETQPVSYDGYFKLYFLLSQNILFYSGF